MNADWFDKLTDTVNNVTREVKKVVDEIDPKQYILQHINSNPELDKYSREIRRKMGDMYQLIDESTSPVIPNQKPEPYKFISSDVKLKIVMPFLQDDTIANAKLLKTKVVVGDKKYKIFLINNYLLPLEISSNSIPVGDNMNEIVKGIIYKKNSKMVNSEFFSNVEKLSNSIANFSYTGMQVSNAFLDGVDSIRNYQYAGYSAISVVDPLVQVTSGMSVSDIETVVKSYKSASKDAYDFSNTLKKNTKDVRVGLINIVNSSTISSSNADKVENGMMNLSKQISGLADEVNNTSETIASFSSALTRLQSFSDIEYFGIISDLLLKIREFTTGLENGLNNYAGGFSEYIGNNNDAVSKITSSSRQYFLGEFDKYIANDLKKSNIINQTLEILFQNKIGYRTLIGGDKKYYKYLKEIVASENNVNSLKKKDLHESYNEFLMLQNKLSNYPVDLSRKYFIELETQIVKKQLIGKPKTEKYDSINESVHKMEVINYIELQRLAKEVNIMTNSVKKANIITYIVFAIIAILITIFIIIKIKKGKNQNISIA